MCRLFGFRSVIPSAVHRSLLEAENALGCQSSAHPDGWGVAYYVEGAPHLVRSDAQAGADQLFHRVSGVVSSETVIAHVRKATAGKVSVLNSHPFQYGRWVFAHNGEIPDYSDYRDALRAEVAEPLLRFVLGETDSEVLFFMFLTVLSEKRPLAERFSSDEVREALAEVGRKVDAICTPKVPREKLLLNFLVTDGHVFVATRRGKELFWSSYKRRCADREVCPSLAPHCEAPTTTGFVNHLLVTSEPIGGENVWVPFDDDFVWRRRAYPACLCNT